MAIELIDVLKTVADMRGTTLEHEVAKHNVAITEQRLEWAANGRSLPAANVEEREARRKAARKRGVDMAREKRQAARKKAKIQVITAPRHELSAMSETSIALQLTKE